MMKKTLIALALMTFAPIGFASMEHHHDAPKTDHADMDHSKMDHSKMDHSKMQGTSAVGMPANGAKPDKVVHVILNDDKSITFKKEVKIEPNDVVQFVVMNVGSEPHEFAIGSQDELVKHRKMMSAMAGMEHDTVNSIIVAPKKARQFVWHFHGDNQVEISCNFAGHAEAGMTKALSI